MPDAANRTLASDEPADYRPLVAIVAAMATGIVADRMAPLAVAVWWGAALASLGVWWLLWRRGREAAGEWFLLATVALAGGAWHHFRWQLFDANELALYAREVGEPVCLDVVALAAPRRLPATSTGAFSGGPQGLLSRVDVRATRLRDGERWVPCSGAASLMVQGDLLEVGASDRLRVFGRLSSETPPMNPGEVDFAQLARGDRRLCRVRTSSPQCVIRLGGGPSYSARRAVDWLTQRGDRLLWNHLDPKHSGLAAAMFLGLRDELDSDQSAAFLETGTIHLLVVSGLNVGILAGCILIVLRLGLARRGTTLAVVAGATVLYAVATGGQPPVVRAAIMVLAVCAARLSQRKPRAISSLALAALIVLAINPTELFRVGTQLSFLSVLALIWVARRGRAPEDPLDRLIRRSRAWPLRLAHQGAQLCGRAMLVSLAIWLLVCPLVMARFHLVSPSAVLLGPLLAAPVAVAMASGFAVLLLGPVVPTAASACGWLCGSSLSVMEQAVAIGRDVPLGHVWVSGPSDWWLAGFYGGVAVIAISRRLRPRPRWCAALAVAWCTVGLAAGWASSRPKGLQCTFVSVGHGCSTIVRMPSGHVLLYDAGRLGSSRTAVRSIAGTLWSQGLMRLDAVVISHADADHYNALPELLERFSVGAVYVSPVMFEDAVGNTARLEQAIRAAGVPLRQIWAGDRLAADPACQIDVLHPGKRGVLGSDNANSVVLSIAYRGKRILLTGDLESPGLDDLLEEEPLDCDVALAPHHGSRFSNPPGFADWCTPEWVVVSGSASDDVRDIVRAYRERKTRLLTTATSGAVTVTVLPGALNVRTFR